MTKTTPKQTPPQREHNSSVDKPNQTMLFISMTFDMGWRLAIVVLLPLIIGNKLDDALNTRPWLTFTGFIIAIVGTVFVIKATVKKADRAIYGGKDKHA